MTPDLEEALTEHFEVGSAMYADVRALMELAIQEERARCMKIADNLSTFSGNDAAGGMAAAIAERIRDGTTPPEAPGKELAQGACIPCLSCGGMRRENCKDYPKHQHDWCDCQ